MSSDCILRTKNVLDLMSYDILDILTAIANILTRIEVIRICHEVLSDTCCHTKTKVRVDVDLADSASCSFTELIFRNADGIL